VNRIRFIGPLAALVVLVGILAACTATDPRLEDESAAPTAAETTAPAAASTPTPPASAALIDPARIQDGLDT